MILWTVRSLGVVLVVLRERVHAHEEREDEADPGDGDLEDGHVYELTMSRTILRTLRLCGENVMAGTLRFSRAACQVVVAAL